MQEPIFHTVQEAARILRVDAATIYRSIRAGSFPAIRIRSRYVIPAAVLREVAAQAVSSGTCVDLTDSAAPIVAGRRCHRASKPSPATCRCDGRFGMREPRKAPAVSPRRDSGGPQVAATSALVALRDEGSDAVV